MKRGHFLVITQDVLRMHSSLVINYDDKAENYHLKVQF